MSISAMRVPSVVPRPVQGRLYGILSTYPPTPCGLATFSAALARGLEANGAAVGIVRVADGTTSSDPRVLAELYNGVPASLTEASATLSCCDVAIVQHDYGLYGGTDGDEILDILRGLTVPSIVVAHTVLAEPTGHQKEVLEAIAEAASVVVVMAHTAQQRLCSRFDVDASKVTTVPHGAATPTPRQPSRPLGPPGVAHVGDCSVGERVSSGPLTPWPT